MRALAALSLATTLALAPDVRAAEGATRRFAVVAGASQGGPGRTPLRYATSDARDVSRVLRRLGGVALDDLVLVEEPDADALRRAFATTAARTAAARAAGHRVELFLYYSGHSDEQALLLGASRLPYTELRRELEGVPAEVRVAILDSCASGAITRAKGGVRRPPFLLDVSSRISGHAFLTSSAADEAAQESDRLRASFFTHALLTGLRGAADASGDGVVTLNEAYQFAFRETLAGTETTQAGPQHATYDIGLVGSGDVVMTDLRRADAVLVVPETLDGRIFVRNAAGQLVAELRKARGARIELALEEGRFDVRVAREVRVLGGSVTLAPGGRVVLDDAQLSPVALDPTTSRGSVEARRDAPAVATDGASSSPARGWVLALRAGGVQSRSRPDRPAGVHAELGLGASFGDHLGVELASGYQRIAGRTRGRMPDPFGYTTEDVREEVVTIPARLTLQAGYPLAHVRPYVLAGAGASYVRFDRYALHETNAWGLPVPGHLRDDRIFLTYHAGVGTDLRISRRVAATIELRYAWGPAELLLQERLELNTFGATAGVAWRL